MTTPGATEAVTPEYERGVHDGLRMAGQIVDEWRRPSKMRLQAGEMSLQELRTAVALLRGVGSAIRSLLPKEAGK